MRIPALLVTLLLTAGPVPAAQTGTAFDAVKALPRAAAKKLARIEARRGTPNPERWHVLVHDTATEHGLREYVIAAGEVVASRTVSQFADKLEADDVIAETPLKIDSDRAAEIAQQYALSNNSPVASMGYELRREGAGATPLWRVTCLDEKGSEVGSVVLTATKGTVVSHPGFPLEPESSDSRAGDPFRPQRNSEIAASEGETAAVSKPLPKKKKSNSAKRKQERPNIFQRTGDTLQKFLTGGR